MNTVGPEDMTVSMENGSYQVWSTRDGTVIARGTSPRRVGSVLFNVENDCIHEWQIASWWRRLAGVHSRCARCGVVVGLGTG